MNIWSQLPKPFFVLAPMDDVTDTVFRQVIANCSPPDLFFTEFANVDGLMSNGRDAVLEKLRVDSDNERPLIAQIWGLNPQNYLKAAQELVTLGFDGIDINMGCPVPAVVSKGACSALIENQPLARDIIAATKEGAAGKIPVSVKTRIGFKRIQTEQWCGFLLEQGIEALTVHGRTSKEMSKVPNHWEEIAKVSTMRSAVAPQTVFIGNGDVLTCQQGQELAVEHNLDGIMIGRGIFQDPYLFSATQPPSGQRLHGSALYLKHIRLFAETWGDTKNPAGLKKFAKMYLREFEGASELREKLMRAQNTSEMIAVIEGNT